MEIIIIKSIIALVGTKFVLDTFIKHIFLGA